MRTAKSRKIESGLIWTHCFERELKFFSQLKYCDSVLQFSLWQQWRFACLQVTILTLWEAGQQRLPFCLNLLHLLCVAGFLNRGQTVPPVGAPPVWDGAWDWPGMHWPTEVWGIWKRAEKGEHAWKQDWPTVKTQSLKKNNFSLDSEISQATHSTQGEPESF